MTKENDVYCVTVEVDGKDKDYYYELDLEDYKKRRADYTLPYLKAKEEEIKKAFPSIKKDNLDLILKKEEKKANRYFWKKEKEIRKGNARVYYKLQNDLSKEQAKLEKDEQKALCKRYWGQILKDGIKSLEKWAEHKAETSVSKTAKFLERVGETTITSFDFLKSCVDVAKSRYNEYQRSKSDKEFMNRFKGDDYITYELNRRKNEGFKVVGNSGYDYNY